MADSYFLPPGGVDIFHKFVTVGGTRKKMQAWQLETGGWCAGSPGEWENGWGQTADQALADLLSKLDSKDEPKPRWFRFLGAR